MPADGTYNNDDHSFDARIAGDGIPMDEWLSKDAPESFQKGLICINSMVMARDYPYPDGDNPFVDDEEIITNLKV
jgi:hypothetical protein